MTKDSQRQHLRFLQQTIDLARQSPPKPTNFRVGCVIVSFQDPSEPRVLSTGYTLQLPGNTHAEQCALANLAHAGDVTQDAVSGHLSSEVNAVLYTSLEPCGKRLSGNLPCVQRIIATRENNSSGGIRKVIFGAKEPGTFVQDSKSCRILTEAGIEWDYVPTFESEILEVAMEGHHSTSGAGSGNIASSHQTDSKTQDQTAHSSVRSTETVTEDLPKRGDHQPRNPKKRMMEDPPPHEASEPQQM